jgi:hypothetical protein
MSANPLVVGRVDTTSPLAGSGLLEDGYDLVQAVQSGSWIDGGLATFSLAIDTVATVSDPLGSLIAAGLGWLMDHLSPLNEWLEDLTGDADQVRAFAATWSNVATQLTTAATELTRKVGTDLDQIRGAAADAYRALTGDLVEHLGGAAGWAGAISTGLQLAATIVQVVHDLVRDTLAQLVGSIISWAAELACTVGLATPLVVEQVSTRVASLATRLGTKITKLVAACKNLGGLLDSLKALFRRSQDLFDRILHANPGAGAGAGVPAAHGADPLADALATVNPRFGMAPRPAYTMNCVHCVQAYEVARRSVKAEATGLPTRFWPWRGRPLSDIETTWGRSFTAGTQADIDEAFRAAGHGARGVVYISWTGPGGRVVGGHVFNVENVGGAVRFVDGQNGSADVAHYFQRGTNTSYVRLDDLPLPHAVSRFIQAIGQR